nr:carboxypeptidase-like regulatory domain-containing protein [Candidatus Eremiobacteraeota bacterium]
MRFLFGRAAVVRLAVAAALLVSSVAGFHSPALAVGGITGTINGNVVDAVSHAPVAGVSVSAVAPAGSSKTVTDAKGFFSFPGLPIDTYTISFTIPGYESFAQQGITVQGDQQVTVNAGLTKSLTKIGRTQSRAASSAFQPKQTTDSYQITGQQAQTALGRAGNISQTQLQSSVPSITTTFYGSSSIRGSTRTEIAYQFDGIDYTDPLSAQFQNSLGLNGLQALQVNPGAGDATQGNAGAGAVNIVVKRGARPAFGGAYFETSAGPRGNYGSLEYGWGTPNGRLSNYSSFVQQNTYSQFGPKGTLPVKSGSFFSSTDFSRTADFINNFVYKFGHDNTRSIQFLYQNRYSDFVLNRGGIGALCFKTCDPNIAGTPTSPGQLAGAAFFALPQAARFADFQQIVGLLPVQRDVNQKIYYQGFNHQPVDVFKFEYAQQLDPRTYWTNRVYRVIGNATFN